MTTASTTEAEPAQEPFVRFAAFRGKVPLPWVTVFVLALLMAAVDGFIVTSIQGAVGAIQRSQSPFASWARDTAILLPVFVVAVMWAFTRAHRKHGLASAAMRSWRRVVTTALLVAAAGGTGRRRAGRRAGRRSSRRGRCWRRGSAHRRTRPP